MLKKEDIKFLRECIRDEKLNNIEKTAIRKKIWELECNREIKFSNPFVHSNEKES